MCMHGMEKKVLRGIITNKDTLPINIGPYFTVLFILKYKKCFLAITFFFHYLTLDCPRECSEALKNKVPRRNMKHIFSVVYATLLMTLNLLNLHIFNKSSYGREEKFYSQKITIVLPRNWLFLVLAAKYYISQDRRSLKT